MNETKKINFIDTNIEWMRQILWDYQKSSQDIGMNYLSMGSLRHNENYFVGYIFNESNTACPIELVSYIQYETTSKKLILNYMEVGEKYRKQGISRLTIEAFAKSVYNVLKSDELEIVATTLSSDAKETNLETKLQEYFDGKVEETGKRNLL